MNLSLFRIAALLVFGGPLMMLTLLLMLALS
jgi:hypothetical protein